MKKLVALALVAALFSVCGTAQAAKVWDDMSWWGNTGATPAPQPDTYCGLGEPRSCYWWWPTEPASNANDAELWGNRGIVYSCWTQPTVTPPPPPPPPAETKATREVPLFNHVLFDYDKSTLKPEGKAEIDKVVAELKLYPNDTAVIEGHTDSNGSDAYNMALGQRRSDAVKDYMVQTGIAPERIQSLSLGESTPAVANDTPANRKLNRRAVFKITIAN